MAMSSSGLKETLAKENHEFKQLYETHQSYEKRLDQLNGRPYLSSDEEFEVLELKKKKLVIKDQMHMMIEQFRQTAS